MLRAGLLLLLFTSLSRGAADPTAAAWETLAHGVQDQNAVKRTQAITAAGTIKGNTRARQLIETALGDKDPAVRVVAATTLGEMEDHKAIPALKGALDDDSPDVAFAVAQALWDLGDRSPRDLLLEVMAGERGDSPGLVRGKMRDARSKMHNKAGLALMGLKQGASMFLGPFGMGIGVVEELMKDNRATARALTATMLADDSSPQSYESLTQALHDKNWAVRVAAAKALGGRGNKAAIPDLLGHVQDSDERDAVRYTASASIVRLGTKRAKPRSSP